LAGAPLGIPFLAIAYTSIDVAIHLMPTDDVQQKDDGQK